VGAGETYIISLLILIGAGLLVVLVHPSASHTETQMVPLAVSNIAAAPSARPASPQTAPTGVSLAVLPFADMSPQHDQDYFSDGLSEELLNQLAQIKDLKVTGRTSSFSFKGKNDDLRVIGEKLGVNHLLEGSVRKDGRELRITAQLINAADGTHLWSQTYDRKLANVFALQEEIAKDVATALSVTLGLGQMTVVAGGTVNVEAYDKYLRAHELANQYQPVEAIPFYRQALSLDPNFVQAWVGLDGALKLAQEFTPEKSVEINDDAARAEARVLALAPQSWWAKVARAGQLIRQNKWAEAESALDAAIAAAPASGTDRQVLRASFLMTVGRVKEASEALERLRQLEPLSIGISFDLQRSLFAAGRTDDSLAEYERGKDLAGDHQASEFYAVLALWWRKDVDPVAVQTQVRLYLQHAAAPAAIVQSLMDKFGDPVAARADLRKAFADPGNQDLIHMLTISFLADHFGDKELALAGVGKLVESDRDWLNNIWFPWKTGLRADPRFKQIVRNLKLDEYFRTSGKWNDSCHPVGNDDFECQ
jgi:TolB-like protein